MTAMTTTASTGTGASPSDAPAPQTEQGAGSRRWIAVVLFTLIVVVMPVATTTIAVARFSALSTLDEFGHIDYVRRAEQGEVPRIGDKVLPDTAKDVACRGIEGRVVSDCKLDPVPPESIDAQGYSYEAQQPPIYYFITAALRQPFRLVVNGYVNSARLTGMIWLSAGLALLWWFLRRRMDASVTATAIVCALIGICPTVASQASVVNNDAAAILMGVLLLIAWDELRRRPRPLTVAIATAGAVGLVLVKPLAILGVAVVSLALLLGARERRAAIREHALLLAPAIAAAITYEGWQVVRDARARVPYSTIVDVLLGPKATLTAYPYDAIGEIAPRFLGLYWSTDASMFTEAWVAGLATIVGLTLVVAPSLSTALGQGRAELRSLHTSLLTVMLIAPELLIAQSYFTVHKGGGANARYALVMLPMIITALVPWLETRRVRWFATIAVLILIGSTFGGLLTYDIPVR
jgi:hypothetical protein